MSEENKDQFWPWAFGIGVLLVAGGIGLYLLRGGPSSEEPVAAPPQPSAAVNALEPTPTPEALPIAPPRALPLPALDDSDVDVLGGLTEIFGQRAVAEYVMPERLVRHIVVTIDNAPREQMALNQRPIKETPGDFVVDGPEEGRVLAPQNYARYEPFVAVVRRLDAKTLVALYRSLEPLFQQAYEELGHPDERFNARLLEVIDHLLATPNVQGEIRLVQPSVLYRYADEALEKRSAGQKLLIRMGPANAGAIKAKLREIQAELR
jgi:hypothetical protein